MYLADLAQQAVPLRLAGSEPIAVPGIVQEAYWYNRTFYAAYKHIITKAPAKQWLSDEDSFGLIKVRFDPVPRATIHPLPVTFPIQSVGAAGAKRSLDLHGLHRKRLLLSVDSPFSDDRGWGDDNFLYAFDLALHRWYRVTREGKYLALTDTAPARPSHAVSGGELIAFATRDDQLVLDSDRTPYHLDDWSTSPQTSARLKQQRRELERQRHGLEDLAIHEFTLDNTMYWFIWPLEQYFSERALNLEKQEPEEEFDLPRNCTYMVVKHDPAVLGSSSFYLGNRGYRFNDAGITGILLLFFNSSDSKLVHYLVIMQDLK